MNKLTITFSHGTQYIYEGVSNKEYTTFEGAESQGKEFNKYIKPKPFTKGEKVDVEKLLEGITNDEMVKVGKKELDRDEKQLIVTMEAFLIKHNTKNDLDLLDLTDLKYFLDKVITSKRDK